MIVSNGTITISDVTDGINAILTQSSLIVACATNGTVITLTGLNTTMKVYIGGLDDSVNWNYYVSNISGVSYADSVGATLRTGTGVTNGAIAGTSAYVKVTSFTGTDSGYIEISATKFGYQTLIQRLDLVKSKAGSRGSVTAQISGQTVWSDAVANAYFATNYNNVVITGDYVTQYGAGFAQTKIWNGTAWQLVTQVVDGNLIVNGTVTTGAIAVGAIGADQISANAITTNKMLVTGAGPTINKDPNTNRNCGPD